MQTNQILIDKIVGYQRKKLIFLFAGNFLNVMVYLLIIWIGTFLADSAFYFSTSSRWFLLILDLALTLYLVYKALIIPIVDYVKLKFEKNLTNIAKEIGELYPEIQDQFANIYQLANFKSPGASSALKDFAVNKFSEKITGINFNEKIKLKNYILPVTTIVMVYLGTIALNVIMHDRVLLSSKRILNPNGDYDIIPKYEFQVRPGDAQIILGKDLEISTSYNGPKFRDCILYMKNKEEMEFQYRKMTISGGDYKSILQNIRKPLEYYIKVIPEENAEWSDKIKSNSFNIQVLEPPALSDIQAVLTPPKYTGLEKQYLKKNVGDIIAFKGSKISISAQTNKQVKKATIIFSDNAELPAKIRERKIISDFIVKDNQTYSFKLTDDNNIQNQNPIEYSITVLDDIYPRIDIIDPGKDIEIATDGALNILLEGNDDFGFKELFINYQILSNIETLLDSTWNRFPVIIPAGAGKYFQQSYLWNFAGLPLGFDYAIKYFASLTDNDIVSGPKESRSNVYFIRFPSLQQLFDEFNDEQAEDIEDLEEIVQDSEKLKKDLDEISREMKRENEIDWERKQQLESSLEKQKNIQEKMNEIQKELEQAVQKLQENQLLSPEVLEKYQQLQQLFREIASPELLQSMNDLQNSMENLNQKQAQQSLEKFKINQQRFKENLERTLELFEKVKLEQELDRLVQTAKKMTEEQENITSEINKENDSNQNITDRLNNKLEEQKESLDQIDKGLDPLIKNKSFRENKNSLENLKSSKEIIDQNQLQSGLESMQEMINSGQRQQAGNQSQEMNESMQDLYSKLQEAQKNMLENEKEKVMSQMQKITENMLKLSQDQESLTRQTEDMSAFSDKFTDITGSQQNINENLKRQVNEIVDLSHQTFFLSPDISLSLSKANDGMKSSISALEDRNQNEAGKNQKQAMSGLNETVMSMQNSMQEMAQSNSSTGFEKFMEQLESMAKKQSMLNQEGLSLFKSEGNKGSLSLSDQARMSRMAAEQQALRQSLEQLDGEMGNRSDVLGRLDNLVEEMDKVVEDLQSLKIDRKTIERQQSILSRMLDAQKSAHQKEYSKERKAEVGKHYARKSPSNEMDTLDKKLDSLKKDLLRALQEGYSSDYEKLIEDYFHYLNQNNLKQ